jgi:hypothetical protein
MEQIDSLRKRISEILAEPKYETMANWQSYRNADPKLQVPGGSEIYAYFCSLSFLFRSNLL